MRELRSSAAGSRRRAPRTRTGNGGNEGAHRYSEAAPPPLTFFPVRYEGFPLGTKAHPAPTAAALRGALLPLGGYLTDREPEEAPDPDFEKF